MDFASKNERHDLQVSKCHFLETHKFKKILRFFTLFFTNNLNHYQDANLQCAPFARRKLAARSERID
jgi:hypothetical protein